MKKFYKVTLYKAEKYREPKEIGTIIAENGFFYAREVMTKQKFRIYPTTSKVDELRRDKEYLFLIERDFCDKNIVTATELERYIDGFEPNLYPFSEVIKEKENELISKKLK